MALLSPEKDKQSCKIVESWDNSVDN